MWSLSSIISLNGAVCDRESTSVYSGDKYVQYIRTGIHGLILCVFINTGVHYVHIIHVRCLCSVYVHVYSFLFSTFIRSLFPDDIKSDKKGRPTTVGNKIRVR